MKVRCVIAHLLDGILSSQSLDLTQLAYSIQVQPVTHVSQKLKACYTELVVSYAAVIETIAD